MSESGIFKAAVKLAADQRAQYLDQACGANHWLRREIESLLRAHDASESFLEASPATMLPSPTGRGAGGEGLMATIERPAERPGLRIGRYRLLEQIGEGGMGTVWVAEQTDPVKRRVALKLIKAGMDTRQVLSRFEAERQALALMDHPNIAKFIDAGTTGEPEASASGSGYPPAHAGGSPSVPSGRPYFVMEYVKGVPITEYCDNARLPIAERLKLFVAVCQAVQHAHQKGVIHRDLKPSNILVCLYDGQPVPKVIDFGLAKAMHQPLTEHTLYTAHGLMVGTPLYMSPEQAEFNNLDVDTRTDIYSLGVILYELLTGTTPLEKQQFKNAALQEILRLIKEVEPPRPSLKISSLSRSRRPGGTSPAKTPSTVNSLEPTIPSSSLELIASQRSLDPSQLSRKVRGDLDWIVMKSLEKERSRRYETASSLARDLERYLNSEPIQARPPSTTYRLNKFAQRNKATVATVLLIAASLLLGTTISTWQAIRATAAERSSQNNLQKLQQVAREWAMSETLTGDPKRAEAAISLAEAADVSNAWTEILRAQSEIDQGLLQAAIKRLQPTTNGTNINGDKDAQLAAVSLLAYAYLISGDDDEFLRCMKRVHKFQHDPNAEAGLFRAAAEFWVEPTKGVITLAESAKKRVYPASFLMRANALALAGVHKREHRL